MEKEKLTKVDQEIQKARLKNVKDNFWKEWNKGWKVWREFCSN